MSMQYSTSLMHLCFNFNTDLVHNMVASSQASPLSERVRGGLERDIHSSSEGGGRSPLISTPNFVVNLACIII